MGVANQVAVGYEQAALADLVRCLGNARGLASEIRSMVGLVSQRPSLARHSEALQQIRNSADSCLRQISAWVHVIEGGGDRPKRTNAAMSATGDGVRGSSPDRNADGKTAPAPAVPMAPSTPTVRANVPLRPKGGAH
jgi:hypothetical protein